LIVAGRGDSTVGYSDATELLERHPRATLAVIEGAGHVLITSGPNCSPRSSATGSIGHARTTSDRLAAIDRVLVTAQVRQVRQVPQARRGDVRGAIPEHDLAPTTLVHRY